MPDGSPEDPRIPLIAAVLAIGETPAGRLLCERFREEAAGLVGQPGPIPPEQLVEVAPPGVASAIEGMAVAFSLVTEHLEYLATKARTQVTRRPRPVEPAPPHR